MNNGRFREGVHYVIVNPINLNPWIVPLWISQSASLILLSCIRSLSNLRLAYFALSSNGCQCHPLHVNQVIFVLFADSTQQSVIEKLSHKNFTRDTMFFFKFTELFKTTCPFLEEKPQEEHVVFLVELRTLCLKGSRIF